MGEASILKYTMEWDRELGKMGVSRSSPSCMNYQLIHQPFVLAAPEYITVIETRRQVVHYTITRNANNRDVFDWALSQLHDDFFYV